MEPKLTILFALIATVIGFAKLRAEYLARLKAIMVRPDWRSVRHRRSG